MSCGRIPRNISALGVGFALDALLGDSHALPHPIRLIGKQITLEEGLIRSYLLPEIEAGTLGKLDQKTAERLMGAALAFDVALVGPLATFGLLKLCDKIHPVVGFCAQSVLCYYMLAARSLRDESMAVYDALSLDNLEQARQAVSQIVGRDTDNLDEEGVVRATVETIAENTSDGVIAPMLYGAIGGAPAMVGYKAVNTLDSMVGYKNEEYENLGFVAAKLDDALNFIPARISGALMCVAARLTKQDATSAQRIFKRDCLNHTSPNAAHTEAACAGALGVELGGGNYYSGQYVEKPTIGDATRPIESEDIVRANRLMYATAALGFASVAVVGCALSVLGGRRARRS